MDVAQNEGGDFVVFIKKRWKLVSIIVALAMIVTGIATSFVEKEYYAYGIVFPAENNSVESVVDNPTVGYDLEADRLIQLLQSDDVFDSVVQKFSLLNYYGYDKGRLDWRDELRIDYEDDINIIRTPYMSVVISAQMREPKMSADIVNYIIHLADGARERFYKKNLFTAYTSLGKEFKQKQEYVDSLQKQIADLRSKTPMDLVVIPNSQYVIQTKTDQAHAEPTTKLERLINTYIYEQFRLNDLTTRYEKAKAQYERPLTQIFIVDSAKPSYKKASPSYSINLAITGVVALIFSIFFLLFTERFRNADKRG